MAYICITGNEKSPRVLEERIERVFSEFPIILCELRIDHLDLNPTAAFAFLAGIPSEYSSRIILTNRLKVSGPTAMGQCSWDVYTWQSWWQNVMALKPWFAVDIDWILLDRLGSESFTWRSKFRSKRTFFSLHQSIDEIDLALPNLLAEAEQHGAGVKIAAPVTQMHDLLRLARITKPVRELPLGIAVAMGATGRVWRWSKLAGKVTYFAAKKDLATAPGQDALEEIREYLLRKRRPELYVLLGNDPENTQGEKKWNRIFSSRQANARYLNLPCADTPSPLWAQSALKFLDLAEVQGASVTRPFKRCFGAPTNTLSKNQGEWVQSNTDGVAVAEILQKQTLNDSVVIAGAGGAALGVQDELVRRGFIVNIWEREDGILPSMPEGKIFISTWPPEFQSDLLGQIPGNRAFSVIVDAQFQVSEERAPLALWAAEKGIPYINGREWWQRQAFHQDLQWFGPSRLGSVQREILTLVPHSKSILIRVLAMSMAIGTKVRVDTVVECEDVQVFIDALLQLGMRKIDSANSTSLFIPPDKINVPEKKIQMGEGATGFRILTLLASVMEPGNLTVDAKESLQKRNHEFLFNHLELNAKKTTWPIEFATGGFLPSSVSVSESSQFATACLIAGAGRIARQEMACYEIVLEGELVSEPYLNLTLKILDAFGFSHQWEGRKIKIERVQRSREVLEFSVEKDASALSYFEIFSYFQKFDSFYSLTDTSLQGDSQFPKLLRELCENKESISLKNNPDLAPSLWVVAALARKKLVVVESSHLRGKESDRSAALVQATLTLGASGNITVDGFVADFKNWRPKFAGAVVLATKNDHRLVMAFLVLATLFKEIRVDEDESMKKSFPLFGDALAILNSALF